MREKDKEIQHLRRVVDSMGSMVTGEEDRPDKRDRALMDDMLLTALGEKDELVDRVHDLITQLTHVKAALATSGG